MKCNFFKWPFNIFQPPILLCTVQLFWKGPVYNNMISICDTFASHRRNSQLIGWFKRNFDSRCPASSPLSPWPPSSLPSSLPSLAPPTWHLETLLENCSPLTGPVLCFWFLGLAAPKCKTKAVKQKAYRTTSFLQSRSALSVSLMPSSKAWSWTAAFNSMLRVRKLLHSSTACLLTADSVPHALGTSFRSPAASTPCLELCSKLIIQNLSRTWDLSSFTFLPPELNSVQAKRQMKSRFNPDSYWGHKN